MSDVTYEIDPASTDAVSFGQVLGARGDVNYEEAGSLTLTAGVVDLEIDFVWQKETADYRFEYCYIEDSNGQPEDIRAVVNVRTTTGFTLKLSAAPDTELSVLRWKVTTPDGLHITQPPTSQPRYVLADGLQPVNENLTTLAGLTLTGYGTGFLSLTDETDALDYIGATGGGFQPANEQLTLLSTLPVQAFGLGALDMANAAEFLSYIGAGSAGGSFVPTTRTITEGAGLAGNTYDLSANRTLAMGTPSTLLVGSVNSASGTTHTHAITSSSNPGAAASILATNAIGQLTLVDLLANATTFNLVNTVATTVNFAGAATTLGIGSTAAGIMTLKSPTINLSGTLLNPVTSYNTDIGQISKKFRALHAAELWVETLVAQDTLATIGGRILVGPTTALIADFGTAATTIDVKHNNLASGDRVYMESSGKVEFMAVTSAATTITGGFRYSVTRNLDGTGANDWFAGDAVFNTGQAGTGFIDLYSLKGVKSATEAGPTIVGNVRNSSTFNDWSARWAIGNMKGLYDYGTDTFGAAFGRYGTAAHTWVSVDATNGFRIVNNITNVGQWYANGDLRIGQATTNEGNVFVTAAGVLSIRRGTTDYITLSATDAQFTNLIKMTGASSAISLGTTPPTSATVGTGIWLDRTGLYSLSSSVQNVTVTSAGITAGGGSVRLSSIGLRLDSTTGLGGGNFGTNTVSWVNSGSDLGSVLHNYVSSGSQLGLVSQSKAGDSGGFAGVSMTAYNNNLDNTIFFVQQNGSAAGDDGIAKLYGNNFTGFTVGSSATPTHTLDVRGDAWVEDDLTIDGTFMLNGVISADLALGTATGTKIATATNQKLGFWNATPVVQPVAVADASGGATVDAEARTALNSLLAKLRTIGIIAT